MTDIRALQNDQRHGNGPQAVQLVAREAEVARLQAIRATRADGAALLVTGEPGVGKPELHDAALGATSEAGTRTLHAAGSSSGGDELLRPRPPDPKRGDSTDEYHVSADRNRGDHH